MNYELTLNHDGTHHSLFEVSPGRRRAVSPDQLDYKLWLQAGNKPETRTLPEPPVYEPPKGPTPEELEEQRLANEARQLSSDINVKSNNITEAKWTAIDSGLELFGHKFATDKDARELLSGVVVGSMLTPKEFYRWKLKDGGWINLTTDQVKALAIAVSQHVEDCFEKEEQLLLKVAQCESKEELDLITW